MADMTPDEARKRWRLKKDDPEVRARYEEALQRWHEKLRPLIEANRRSEQLTGDDFNIRVGPCRD